MLNRACASRIRPGIDGQYHDADGEYKAKAVLCSVMDEGRKRVIGIMAAVLTAMHMRTADDLFGTPQGRPRTDRLIDASIQWAERIMEKIDNTYARKIGQ